MGEGPRLTADGFGELFAEQARGLRRAAYLMCGDWQRAEDLVQTTFAKVYAARRRVREAVTLPAYLRQTLTRTYLDEASRRWNGEQPRAAVPDHAATGDPQATSEDRMVLLAALAALPAHQRACLVLRFYEDCNVEETAAALGCAEGTVKSTTSRGLAALRSVLADGAPGRVSPESFDRSTYLLKEA